jgi:hypothetical protein
MVSSNDTLKAQKHTIVFEIRIRVIDGAARSRIKGG